VPWTSLQDLNKANVIKPTNAFILKTHGNVKRMLSNYKGSLEDLDKVNVLEPNDA
jgi:hypothetical protein